VLDLPLVATDPAESLVDVSLESEAAPSRPVQHEQQGVIDGR